MRSASTAVRGLVAALLLAATSSPAIGGEKKQAPPEEREFTVGLVQRELKVGMSQTDVATALGSPNLVTRSSQGREAWVYDRVASEARVHSSGLSGGLGGLAAPGTSLILGMLGGHSRDDKAVTTQRTLTVVVRFGGDGAVESFSFHASRF